MDKLKSLISTHNQKSEDSVDNDGIVLDEKHLSKKKSWEEYQDDPAERTAVMESIEDEMYKGDIDPSLRLLNQLPEQINLIALEEQRHTMRLQHYFVGRQLTDELLSNKDDFGVELDRVIDLEHDLQKTFATVLDIRFSVKQAKLGLTDGSIALLGYYAQRQKLLSLLKILKTIKVLHNTDEKLKEYMANEDYPGAIQLCRDCQHAAVTYRQYTCIQDLNSKLKDTSVLIEEKLDQMLALMCVSYDYTRYHNLTTAYLLLGKLQSAMDQLHMHFTSAIHSKAYEIVYRYAANTNVETKQKYEDLCKYVPLDLYIPCLIELLTMLWGIMGSYQKMLDYHENDNRCTEQLSQFDRTYVQKKLQIGLTRIWSDIQNKVHPYLIAQDLSLFQFDDFIKVLDLINRLISVGEEFCKTEDIPCEPLRAPLRTQSVQYFRSFHQDRAGELAMFLQHELWELWPIKPTFTTFQLNEFRFFNKGHESLEKSKLNENTGGFFAEESTSPFVFTEEDDLEETFFGDGADTDEEEEVDEELKVDYIDEEGVGGRLDPKSRSKPKSRPTARITFHNSSRDGPILTNTTLNVLRYLGKYMQMMNALHPIAFDVLVSMSQLFEYYMYAVYVFFASRNLEGSSSKLAQLLFKIQNTIIRVEGAGGGGGEGRSGKGFSIPPPLVSDLIELHNPQNLFGLKERLIATESLVFLSDQFELWKGYLEDRIPEDKKVFLNQFYHQTLPLARELRDTVYGSIAGKALSYNAIITQMASIKWDVRDLMSEPNSYVYILLQEMEGLQQKLAIVSQAVPFPLEVYKILWTNCITEINGVFLEGFGSAKKCTHEGRAWMQLDYQQFVSQIDRFTTIKPIPGKEAVENFIKAYYLTETDLEQWIRDNHLRYNSKQLNSLIYCTTTQFSKMIQRNKLSSLVEELLKNK